MRMNGLRRMLAGGWLLGVMALGGAGCATGPAGPAGPASRSVAGGDAVVAEAPTFKVGDEWRWEGASYPMYLRVVEVLDSGSVVEANVDLWCWQGCRYIRDRKGMATSAVNDKGEPVYVMGLNQLDFPLKVGKEWTQRLDLRQLSDGAVRPFDNRWKVEAFEVVTVKAGTFKAFRITWRQDNRGGQQPWSGTWSLWWSPEVKGYVKQVFHTTGSSQDWELASFVLK